MKSTEPVFPSLPGIRVGGFGSFTGGIECFIFRCARALTVPSITSLKPSDGEVDLIGKDITDSIELLARKFLFCNSLRSIRGSDLLWVICEREVWRSEKSSTSYVKWQRILITIWKILIGVYRYRIKYLTLWLFIEWFGTSSIEITAISRRNRIFITLVFCLSNWICYHQVEVATFCGLQLLRVSVICMKKLLPWKKWKVLVFISFCTGTGMYLWCNI